MATKLDKLKARRGPNKHSGRDRAELIAPGANALMTREAVACALMISVRKFYLMLKDGEFPDADFNVGQNPRWTRETFNGWVAEQQAKAREV